MWGMRNEKNFGVQDLIILTGGMWNSFNIEGGNAGWGTENIILQMLCGELQL